MRPKKQETTGSSDLFRAQLDQIINMRHELVQLAVEIDWHFSTSRLQRFTATKAARHREPVRDRPIVAQAHLAGCAKCGIVANALGL